VNNKLLLTAGVVSLAITGAALAQGMMGGAPGKNPGQTGPQAGNGMMGGMMGSRGMMSSGGMMGASGMMGAGGMMGNSGGMMSVYQPGAKPIPLAEATRLARDYAQRYGQGARLTEPTTFASNYYLQVLDARGKGIAELLVDRFTGAVRPEHGPNMMWNTASDGTGAAGMMASGGMMGGVDRGATAAPRYDLTAARRVADSFLNNYQPGARALEGTTFPGYFTFSFGIGGRGGVLSVNASTGEVWVHTWHGLPLAPSR
jgi:hypothetical protein